MSFYAEYLYNKTIGRATKRYFNFRPDLNQIAALFRFVELFEIFAHGFRLEKFAGFRFRLKHKL